MANHLLRLAVIAAVSALPIAASAQVLADRLVADEQRIRDALRLGQLTTPEFNELQGRHDAIERTRREQLAQGGGGFLPGQLRDLDGREAALSQTIFRYRHNGATPSAR